MNRHIFCWLRCTSTKRQLFDFKILNFLVWLLLQTCFYLREGLIRLIFLLATPSGDRWRNHCQSRRLWPSADWAGNARLRDCATLTKGKPRALWLVENHLLLKHQTSTNNRGPQSQIESNLLKCCWSHGKLYIRKKLYFCGNITETARNVTLFIYFSTRIPMVSISKQNF